MRGTKKFINPYAFVRLPKEKALAADIKETDNIYTGKIECSLYPRTPLFIPNTTNEFYFGKDEKNEEHKSYDFYSYADISEVTDKTDKDKPHEPIIPGSSIRGEVRSLFEALTGSCLSTAGKELVLYKRMPNPGKMGVLGREGNDIYLYEATKYMAAMEDNYNDSSEKRLNGKNVGKYFNKNKFKEGQQVWFKPSKNSYGGCHKIPKTVDEIYTEEHKGDGFQVGYILLGEQFGSKNKNNNNKNNKYKHHFSIACIEIDSNGKDKKVINRKLIDRELEMLGQVLAQYADQRINQGLIARGGKPKTHYGYEGYKKLYDSFMSNAAEVKYIPVFYKSRKEGSGNDRKQHIYLSPSCITKEIYQNTILDILKKQGLNPCDSTKKLCPACNLFGMVGEKNKEAMSGRVRFSDAILVGDKNILSDIYEEQKTLKELAGPKVSTTEFYLRAPSAENNDEEITVEQINKQEIPDINDVSGSFSSLADLGAAFGLEKTQQKKNDSEYFGYGADMWNYDYAFDWVSSEKGGKEPGPSKSEYKPRLSGRKFYWHVKNFDWSKVESTKNDRNNTIKPIKPCRRESGDENPDYCFKFDVYFNGVTQKELEQIVAVLNLNFDNEKSGYHAIGHGKPLGMGSSKIEVDNVKILNLYIDNGKIVRALDNKSDDYKELTLTDAYDNNTQVRQVAAICTVHDFEYEITYPKTEKGFDNGFDKGYEWFVYNRLTNYPVIDQTLRELPDDSESLCDTQKLEEYVFLYTNNKKK